MRDLCDVAYAMQVERVEREALAGWQASAALAAAGAEVEWRTPGEARAQFNAALAAEPVDKYAGMDPGQLQLRRALGVA